MGRNNSAELRVFQHLRGLYNLWKEPFKIFGNQNSGKRDNKNVHLNIRSLPNKVSELKNIVKQHGPHILGISKCELKKFRKIMMRVNWKFLGMTFYSQSLGQYMGMQCIASCNVCQEFSSLWTSSWFGRWSGPICLDSRRFQG